MISSNQRIKSSVLKRGAFLSEYVALGSGASTVVFESGLGDGSKIWSAVINELKNVTKTFSYNRVGYGKSSSIHKQRRLCRCRGVAFSVARVELHAALHSRRPFI